MVRVRALRRAWILYGGWMFCAQLAVVPDVVRADGPCDGPSYVDTLTFGGDSGEEVWSVARGRDGSLVLAGMFGFQPGYVADFDPGEGEDFHTSQGGNDLFVTKFNPDGTYAWTRTIGGRWTERANGVAVDHRGDIIVVGYFGGFQLPYRVDFDPTDGVDPRDNAGQEDIFITKLHADGSYAWTHTLGDDSVQMADAVAIDGEDNILVVGMFFGNFDFDPTDGVDERDSEGGHDLFCLRLGPDGSYGWTISLGGNGRTSEAYAVAVDDEDNVLVGGEFSSEMDFDFGEGQDFHGDFEPGSNAFVMKYRPDASYVWAQTFGDDDDVMILDLATGDDGSVFACGIFRGKLDFDPGQGRFVRRDPGDGGMFLSKFARDGTYLWSYVPEGSVEDEDAWGVGVDAGGNSYITGEFNLVVDFDPRAGRDRRVANGGSDVYVTMVRPNGRYGWTRTFGGTFFDKGRDMVISADGHISAVGRFYRTVDFDPTDEKDERESNGQGDVYLTRWFCGACELVVAHDARVRRSGTIESRISTALPQGRVKVRCKGTEAKITKRRTLDSTGQALVRFKSLPPGTYTVTIRRVIGPPATDADSTPACQGAISRRRVTVR